MKATSKFNHVVVFDGTAAYVIPVSELANEIEQNEVEVLDYFHTMQAANNFCDKENETINN